MSDSFQPLPGTREPAEAGPTVQRWVLHYPAKPWLMNEDNKLHHMARRRLKDEWRDAFWGLAKEAHIPPQRQISLVVTQFYTGPEPDPDACAPAVKAAIDGLVLAGVVPDDKGQYVSPITYTCPQRSVAHALELVVTAVQQ